ncbi:MAG: zf-TFIIB domain-containing protein [Deltaproteobacteria bacterium]|nr:zf-TFIIB domain-containing protein [Deltaproteobacteria bacterium]MBN2673630.1 zf-TFIIB domain-containing protein [Deltaproteobacteria bacterium]
MGLDCPRCTNGKLEEIEVDEILIDRCVVCGGVWFDQGELTQIVGEESGVKDLEAAMPEKQADILCPRCVDIILREQQLCELDGVSVSVYRCPSCLGTWMDRGVLRKSEDEHLAQNTKSCFTNILVKSSS